MKIIHLEDKESFKKNVEKAKQYIVEGDIFQVVLSRNVKVKINESGLNLYKNLRKINFSEYMFYINYIEYELFGSSPEILIKKIGNTVYSCPIAGTRKRGKDIEEDKKLELELITDIKEISEHNMLVDLARNDLCKISKESIYDIKLEKYMDIKKFSHVMHLTSLISGKLSKDVDYIDIIKAIFPAGTVSGAPKVRAMEIIEEFETYARGTYAGGVGYFDIYGNLNMCITIRSALKIKDELYLQSGAGIVYESDAEREYFETESKLKALYKILSNAQ